MSKTVSNDIDDHISDELLLNEYSQGNMSAFECLYNKHKKGVFHFIRRQCRNESIAEELTHDTWLAVIRQAQSYKPTARFATWLYRIAHNRLVDYWRKYGRSSNVLFEELSDAVLSNQCVVEKNNAALSNVVLDELFESLEALSAEQLEALLLKIEGFSYAEIADITQAGQETVKSRLRYATQRLRVSAEVVYD